MRGQGNIDDPAVRRILGSPDEAVLFGALDQPDDRVMALLEEFGKLRYGRRAAASEALDPQHQLVLLRSDPTLPGGVFTETKKFTQRIPELRKIAHDRLSPGSG